MLDEYLFPTKKEVSQLLKDSFQRKTHRIWSTKPRYWHSYHLNDKQIKASKLTDIIHQMKQHEAQINEEAQLLIYLTNNKLGALGCQILSKATFDNLTTLSLKSNSIGDEGCRYLAKCDWNSLEVLGLRNNQIGEKGCSHLVKKQWSGLDTLHINQNKIGLEGFKYLKNGLPLRCTIYNDATSLISSTFGWFY